MVKAVGVCVLLVWTFVFKLHSNSVVEPTTFNLAEELSKNLVIEEVAQASIIAMGYSRNHTLQVQSGVLISPLLGSKEQVSQLDMILIERSEIETLSTVYCADALAELVQGRSLLHTKAKMVLLGLSIEMPDKVFFTQDIEVFHDSELLNQYKNHPFWYRIYFPQ